MSKIDSCIVCGALTSLLFIENNPFISNRSSVDNSNSFGEDMSRLCVGEVRVAGSGKSDRHDVVGVDIRVTSVDVETTLNR